MGFFEDKLSAVGRTLDAGGEWCADRWRAAADRRRHADSFDAIRERMERAKRAARDRAEQAGDAARERWSRHDIDASSLRRAGAWLGVLAVVVLVGLGVRAMTAPQSATLTQSEIDAIRALSAPRPQADENIDPGLRNWISQP